MTNLKYLSNFLTDTFGAVCFYNSTIDGFVNFADKDKNMETLLVVFPSFLDLNNCQVKDRVENKMGDLFYNDKQTFSSLTPLFGGAIISSFTYKNITRIFYENISGYPIVQGIVDYFAGNDLNNLTIKEMYHFKILQTSKDFDINPDKTLKQCIEDYLKFKKIPLVSSENGFYKVPQLKNQAEVDSYIDETHLLVQTFERELDNIKRLNNDLKTNFSQSFSKLSEQQKQEFVNKYFFTKYEKPNICSNPEFDD